MRGLILFLCTLAAAAAVTQTAAAHSRPGMHNLRHAVNAAFCHTPKHSCRYAQEAMRVIHCETGGTYSVFARNGQYLGLFQMGSYARGRYGHGWNPWIQAKAAARYFFASGRDWSPWACKPW